MPLKINSYDFLPKHVRDRYPFIDHVSTKRVRYVAKKLPSGDLVIKEDGEKKETVFIVKFGFTKGHFQLLVQDEKGKGLLMLQRQNLTLHGRWDGYCDSAVNVAYKKQVFTMSKCEIIQDHVEIDVSLTEDKDTSLEKYGPLVYDLSPETEAFLCWKHNTNLLNDLLDKEESLQKKGPSPDLEKHVALVKALLEKFIPLKKVESKLKEKRKGKKEKAKGEFDFKIVGSWSRKELTVFERDLETRIAQVSPHDTKKDKFFIDITSKVDCTFVISLAAAVDSMKSTGALHLAGKAASGALKVFGVAGPIIGTVAGVSGMPPSS